MTSDEKWFTEKCDDSGSSFSLKVTQKLHEEQSAYQHIEVYATEHFGHLLVLDGYIMLTALDNFIYHEMMTHPVLFTHPDPRRVLIIGGGDCGCLHEVLKHPGVTQADQVDIDERVTRVAEEYFPELCVSNDDARAALHFVDGIKWVEDAAPGYYDVIIIDSTDPIGQAARLFSQEFYASCRRALGENGLLVAQSESPLLHRELIEAMQDRMVSAGFAEVTTCYFPQPTYPSGWWTATMACNDRALPGFRAQDAVDRGFTTRYYNEQIHRAAFAIPEFMNVSLDLPVD